MIRIILIPLFVKQIKSSRNMQLLQPRVKELQKKYGHDRERLAQETMALYKETGTNPFASCLPILLQMPIFFALFRLINAASRPGYSKHGVLTGDQADQLREATLFGADLAGKLMDMGSVNTMVLAVLLVLAMTATTFLTQKQLMSKNMPADAMTGQYAQTQKMLLYVLPFAFAVGGVAFPIGVLLYWSTSNLWTMGQQFYVIRNNPAPGTPAAKAKAERDAKHGKGPLAEGAATGGPTTAATTGSGTGTGTTTEQPPRPPQRNQPKNQPRSQRQQAGRNPGQAKNQHGKNNQRAKNAGQTRKKSRPDITRPTDDRRRGS